MNIGSFARELCLCAAGCAILARLLPRGNLKKYGESLIALFVLLVLFLPVGRLMKKKAALPRLGEYTVAERVGAQDAVARAAEKETSRAIRAALSQAGISFASVSVDCHIDGDGVINIDRVQISTDDGARARELLFEQFGIGENICEITASESGS